MFSAVRTIPIILTCPLRFTTLLCAFVLVVVTNVGWSWWFVSGVEHLDGGLGTVTGAGHSLLEGDGGYETRLIIRWSSRTWSAYGTIRHDFRWPDTSVYKASYPGANSFADVAPRWVRATVGRAVGARVEHRFATVGWPLRLLWIGVECGDEEDRLVPWTGIPIDHQAPHRDVFHALAPIRPIWLSQAVLAIFWMVVVTVVRSALLAWRGWWRGRLGRCRGCGYDLRGSAGEVCSECGSARERVNAVASVDS